MSILTGAHGPSDELISFYFRYLETIVLHAESKRIMYIPPSTTPQFVKLSAENADALLGPKALNAASKQLILLAVNNNQGLGIGETHWSLLMLSKFEQTFLEAFYKKRNRR